MIIHSPSTFSEAEAEVEVERVAFHLGPEARYGEQRVQGTNRIHLTLIQLVTN